MSKKIYTISGLVMVLAIGLVLYRIFAVSDSVKTEQLTVVAPTPDERKSSLSGELVSAEIAARPLVALMVENHVDARPQTGLSFAEIVWEAVAEGGITRYVALFQKDVATVGPVRSARDYFAQVANGYGGIYAHVGGSPEVLTQLAQGRYSRLVDVNEFYQGDLFDRISSRTAPHNAYARVGDIRARYAVQAVTAPSAYSFTANPTQVGIPATRIRVDFSVPSYEVMFEYDRMRDAYARVVAGEKDVDRATASQLAPRTVIVELVRVTPIAGDDKGRVDVAVLGSGIAYIFQNGLVTKGTWMRKAGQPAEYADAAGTPVMFAPGQLWIAAVPDDGSRIEWE
ncbi:MAG: DUF3048 domain-containing protein [Candidatus Doudnabacteria bacterium]|nr:DUF3048 domain-containing protein [Candidatus Doudnabacteria bacterium]